MFTLHNILTRNIEILPEACDIEEQQRIKTNKNEKANKPENKDGEDEETETKKKQTRGTPRHKVRPVRTCVRACMHACGGVFF